MVQPKYEQHQIHFLLESFLPEKRILLMLKHFLTRSNKSLIQEYLDQVHKTQSTHELHSKHGKSSSITESYYSQIRHYHDN